MGQQCERVVPLEGFSDVPEVSPAVRAKDSSMGRSGAAEGVRRGRVEILYG